MLNVLIITDKRAGHESLSNGLAKNLEKRWRVQSYKIESQIRAKFLKKIATFILNTIKLNRKNIPFFIKLLYKNFSMDFDKNYDLIISTGGDTSFLNILLANYLKIPNIYCSSLRGLKNTHFSYIISIIDNHIQNEIVVDTPPIHVELQNKTLSGEYIAILIGGATKNYSFSDDDFVEIVKNSIELAKSRGYKILLSTSRRTPIEVENRLERICEEEKEIVKESVLFNKKPKKIVNYFLSNASVVFCTEDSGSMITESIIAKKRVYTIKPKKRKLNRLYKLFMKNLTDKGYIYSTEIEEIKNLSLKEDFSFIKSKDTEKIINKIEKIITRESK